MTVTLQAARAKNRADLQIGAALNKYESQVFSDGPSSRVYSSPQGHPLSVLSAVTLSPLALVPRENPISPVNGPGSGLPPKIRTLAVPPECFVGYPLLLFQIPYLGLTSFTITFQGHKIKGISLKPA